MTVDPSAREIFAKIINFEPSPRTLKWEFGYLSLTIPRWYREGLPRRDKSTPIPETLILQAESFALPFVTKNSVTLREPNDVSTYFNLDEGFLGVPVNYWLFPAFEEEILYEDDTYIERRDNDGIRKREYRDHSSMPLWLEFPVKSRKDWEKVKSERLNLADIDKRFSSATHLERFIKDSENRTAPLIINNLPVGFFGSLRKLMGEERLFYTYYDDPGLIKDMLNHFCVLWLSMAEALTAQLDFDIGYFWEDMSYKNGPLISPAMFREFMTPCYRKVTDFFKSRGIHKSIVDTDGNVEKLIPLFLEAGVNMMYPFERQAGNDLLEYRNRYPDLVMMAGFDKNTLYKGKQQIDAELDILTGLIEKGGFIPHADHFLPHNVSWGNFKYYREKLNAIIDSTEVVGS